MDTEAIRIKFLPETVRILFVGESPPAGGKFFYIKSPMTAFTARAFEAAHRKQFTPDNQQEFLEYFKSCGCFLDDICHDPIDNLPNEQREKALADCVDDFADRLKALKPQVIVVVIKKIAAHTKLAADRADVDIPMCVLPFPGHGHQNKYITELEEILREWLPAGP